MEALISAHVFLKMTVDTVFVQHNVQQDLAEAVYDTGLTYFLSK